MAVGIISDKGITVSVAAGNEGDSQHYNKNRILKNRILKNVFLKQHFFETVFMCLSLHYHYYTIDRYYSASSHNHTFPNPIPPYSSPIFICILHTTPHHTGCNAPGDSVKQYFFETLFICLSLH